jgi:putative beta-lysine N-acetyltransferase
MNMVDGSVVAGPANVPTQVRGDGFDARILFSPLNQRIQVLSYEANHTQTLVKSLANGADEAEFGKVFLKAPMHEKPGFEEAGMVAEATINGYFAGQPAVVMSLFLDEDRLHQPHAEEEESILSSIRSRPKKALRSTLPAGHTMSRATPADAVGLAALYDQVFASYPFPITDPRYLVSTMATHVVYRIIRNADGKIVAAASAEIDFEHHNAEMTDFATLPETRGLGLAQHLLAALEEDAAERGIINLYTVARARSAGMNRVFFNNGYSWTGTLVNNCHIAGGFEDMHVWCKNTAVH